MRIIPMLCLSLFVTVAASNAQRSGDIPVEEWREMALGKTLTYTVDGAFFALERYALSGNRVEIQMVTGECMSGTWEYENGAYCFYWEQNPKVCFRHFRAGDQIIISNVIDGVEIGSFQSMIAVTDAPLQCGMNLS